MAREVFEQWVGPAHVEREDGRMAMIIHIERDAEASGMFVKLQSWDKGKRHETLGQFVGHRVRVTVETVD